MASASRRAFFVLAFIGFLFFGMTGILSALNHNYNRPNPYMDYVPQEVGIYDSEYSDLTEADCRQCHGQSLADRHHNTEIVKRDHLCFPCHDQIPNPPGVVVYRDCVVDSGTMGCHSWDRVLGGNGWHHETATWDDPTSCVTCHKPNLICPIGEFQSAEQYPPNVLSPSPFCCENCHWEQQVVAGDPVPSDPAEAGHPSTFDHHNQDGNFVGYSWYGKNIAGNYDTHHMGFKGGFFYEDCSRCHSKDPNGETWNPSDFELIRYCEVCHGLEVLMTIPQHMNDSPSWEAVGFHTSYPGTKPSQYRAFTVYEKCFACHPGGTDPDPTPPDECLGYGPDAPAIDHAGGILPTAGACNNTFVTLRGEQFGGEQHEDSFVQMRKNSSDPWTNIPVYSWSNTQIEFEIPCGTLATGNYRVRVHTACGDSNQVGFALQESCCSVSLTTSGPCGTVIALSGSGFGDTRNTDPDGITGEGGIARFVEFGSSQGTYTATTYPAWSDTSVKVKFSNFFRDDSNPRNFVADGTDPIIAKCNGGHELWLGLYSVYMITVYYTDMDLSGGLTIGDLITQVYYSDPGTFELTDDPVIYQLKPGNIERKNKLKILGQNFGPDQTTGEVRGGSKTDAQNPSLGKGTLFSVIKEWSGTMVKVKFTAPSSWTGKTKYVWIEKDGKKSNYKPVKVLPTTP